MATVVKNFRIKSGLIVEGTTATVNGQNILSETGGDAYILNLVGGATLVKSVDSGVFGVDGVGNLTINANTFDSYGSASAAQSAAATDATSKANAAQAAAEATASADATSKANAAQAAAEATASADATSKANAAQSSAATDATTKANAAQAAAEATASADATSKANAAQSSAATDATTKANAAQAAAEATASADATTKANAAQSAAAADATTKANAAETAANSYTNTKVAALVDSAPEVLDTLNELAAAIADNPNYASDVANLVATKANTSYVNSEISDLDTAAQGYANTAESEANSYTDGREIAITTAYQTYADTAQTDAETFATDAINALDTDDIEEGSVNQYFTDERARYSAIGLLINSDQENISITANLTGGLLIAAENGVADSDTDDLTEGSANLYFTDARAVSALEAVVPNFTAVELNSVAKQVAATLEAPAVGVQTAYAFVKSAYRSAEFLVKVAYGSHTQISKVLLTLDSSDNIAITEYGVVGTNGSAASVSAGISGSNVQLLVTTDTVNSTVTVMGTLLV
jgi:hypothetical protein